MASCMAIRGSAAATRSAVVCSASSPAPRAPVALNRRAMGATLGAAALVFAPVQQAKAILLDEDDEDMIEKAKANRRARIAQQADVAKEFNKTEGFKTGDLEKDLVPVQEAVYKLGKVGALLEADDVKGANAIMAGAWVANFETAAAAVSTNSTAKKSEAPVFKELKGLQKQLSSGARDPSKEAFVALVVAVEQWAKDANVATLIKGL